MHTPNAPARFAASRRRLARLTALTAAAALSATLATRDASATTSPRAVDSPLAGNGHNVSFDGRLFVVTTGAGWDARVLRPERVSTAGGFPDVSEAFSPPVVIQPPVNSENALALCEADAARTPFRCDAAGNSSAAGPFACYDLFVIDSDAAAPMAINFILRRRRLFVWVRDPGTRDAAVERFEWRETMRPLAPTLRGIEPTVTRDGRLMVWQGHPANDGRIDNLMYAYNPTPCGLTGWTTPRNLTAMYTDPLPAVRAYRLAERQLRASTGELYAATQPLPGAYPWLFPDGDAVNFTAVNMPCRSTSPEDPPGCGPRRNAISVVGYPTNWGVAHVDGAVNPDTDQTVRLFFSSPGPRNAMPLPMTAGRDVWPFFGSNTHNYTELVFDDGLDGNYGGVWHFNEAVAPNGTYDRGRTPDSSGFFNTGVVLAGATFPPRNNGFLGKALEFNGTGARVEVPHAASLNPVNYLTVELRVRPAADPDCDGGNNYRWLLRKGAGYSLVFEDDRQVHARVGVGGREYEVWSGRALPVGAWTHVAFTYEAASGRLALFLDGTEVARTMNPPGVLTPSPEPLRIGALGPAPACPGTGSGGFHGAIDEVAVSRVLRFGSVTPGLDAGVVEPPRDAGTSAPDAGRDASAVVPPDAASGLDASTTRGDASGGDAGARRDSGSSESEVSGCACSATTGAARGGRRASAGVLLGLIALAVMARRARRAGVHGLKAVADEGAPSSPPTMGRRASPGMCTRVDRCHRTRASSRAVTTHAPRRGAPRSDIPGEARACS